MKQALEINDLPELAKLLTAAEAADFIRIQNGRFATGSLIRRFHLSRLFAPCGSTRPTLTDFFRIMCKKRR